MGSLQSSDAAQHRQHRANDLRRLPEPGKQGLILKLEKHVDRDLFYGLCQTLIGNLDGVSDPATALGVALNHIKRWKAFLAGKRTRVLSAEEVRGLFAELNFLRLIKEKHLTDAQAVEAWCGPDRTHQDFIFGELKAATDAYLYMLQLEQLRIPFSISEQSDMLQSGPLNQRNEASLRYRMRNISFVMQEINLPTLKAYAPINGSSLCNNGKTIGQL